MKKIKLGLCDDINYLCEYFKSVFDMEDDMKVVGMAFTCPECIKMVKEKNPDVLLLDIQMETGDSGISLVPKIKEIKPDIKIIMFTIHKEEEYILRLFSLGIDDYIIKTMPVNEILDAIRNVYNRKQSLRPELAKIILNECHRIEARQNSLLYIVNLLAKLSAAEFEILHALYDGKSYAEIAKTRFVTEETIRSQVVRILKKFHVKKMNTLIDDLKEIKAFEIFKK